MKSFLFLILLPVFVLHFGTSDIFAQSGKKQKEVIVIEFRIPGNDSIKREVPIYKNSELAGGIGGGSFSGSVGGCSHCSQAEIERINKELREESRKQSSSYLAQAWRVNKNLSKLKFTASTKGGGCKTEKKISVYRNRQTKVELKCGINLTAYYALESEKAN